MKKTSSIPVFIESEKDFNKALLEYSKEKTRISYNCSICNRYYEISLVKANLPLLCRSCRIKSTTIKNFGSLESANENRIRKSKETAIMRYGSVENMYTQAHEKAKETCLEKFGVENPMQNVDINKKAHETIKEKYGRDYFSQTQEYTDKVRKTSLEKYGTEHFLQSETVKEKISNTLKEKYNVSNPMQYDKILEKSKSTNLERYGAKCVFCKESSLKPIINDVIKEKYGVENVFQNEEIKTKSHDTCLKHYGVPNYSQSELSRKNRRSQFSYDDISFDSSWELCFYIYHKLNGRNIKRSDTKFEYVFEGKTHVYFPDFEMDGVLYEIKGDQFFKEDGTMQNPYDHSQDELFEAKHQCGLKNNVVFVRQNEIKKIILFLENNDYALN